MTRGLSSTLAFLAAAPLTAVFIAGFARYDLGMSRVAIRVDALSGAGLIFAAVTLRDRERRDAERFNRPPKHRGAGYWALHSLSHAFMAELALECGYPLSSLKERIYSSGPAQADRFGILIYTSTAGGQGTLGGLSNMAERAGELLARTETSWALLERPDLRRTQRGKRGVPAAGRCLPRLFARARDVLRGAKYAARSSAADQNGFGRWIPFVGVNQVYVLRCRASSSPAPWRSGAGGRSRFGSCPRHSQYSGGRRMFSS